MNHDLLSRVLEPANLASAWKQVRSNKGAPGIDGVTIEAYPDAAKQHWPSVRQALLDGTYQPSPVRRHVIGKPDGGERLLGIPTVMDRVIQQAIVHLKLMGRYLRSGVMIEGNVYPTRVGTPQGGPLSPLLSNVVLDELDKELEYRGHCFARLL